jgi:DNA-binding NarL/FixJ family response regulator
MPRNGRFEATRIIRRESRDCNIVVVTRNDTRVAGEQAATLNASGFVAKSDLTRDSCGGWQWTVAAWARQKMERATVSLGAVF